MIRKNVCTTATVPYSTGQGVENMSTYTKDLGCRDSKVWIGKKKKLAQGNKTKTWTNDEGVTYTKKYTYYEK